MFFVRFSWTLTVLKALRRVPLTEHTFDLPDICSCPGLRCQSRKPVRKTHQFHSDAGSECVGPEYANMQMLCCQDADNRKTARRQNCPTSLQNNFILSRRDLTEWLCEEHPVYRKHLLTFYRFARGIMKKKKKEHGNDSSSLPLQGCLEWQGQTKVVRYSHFWK